MKKLKTHAFESMKAAAGSGRWPMAVIQAAKAAGCPAFRGNRVYGDELDGWLTKHPAVRSARPDDSLKGRKLSEEIRKLKLANDLKENRLISRQWMAERMQAVAGRITQYRLKSEAEHPLLFAAAAGDVPACREVVKKI